LFSVRALGTVIRRWLAHPLLRGADIDDPNTLPLRGQIIQSKLPLKKIYVEWYQAIAAAVPTGKGLVVEVGCGSGFLRDVLQNVVATDVFLHSGLHVVLNATHLPLADRSLCGIVMTNVLHHLQRPRRFFSEAARCVRPDGVVVMVEPWTTAWSRVIYRFVHHEPFQPWAANWESPSSGPMHGANQALPWIIFRRDVAQFEQLYPEWRIEKIKPIMPFRYLLSGGVSMRNLMPDWTFYLWLWLEELLGPLLGSMAMFAVIILRRVEPRRAAAPPVAGRETN
tara:strand:+ start:407 stop:1249 length:843 start_codon:yes stop_codon:yes gene_type:complete